MPISSSTAFFVYPFLDPFLPVNTLFLLLTVNRNPHLYTSTTDHGAPGPPSHAIVRHYQKHPGQFWQSHAHRNPVCTFRTFSLARQVTYVTRDHILSRWDLFDEVLPWAHQKVRKQNKGEENIYLRRRTPRQASTQRRYCAASLVLALFLSPQTNLHLSPSCLLPRRRPSIITLWEALNSHPVNVPYMAQLVMVIFGLRNCSWGRPSGLTLGMPWACRGFETACNGYFVFPLASIAEIPT